VFGQDPILRVYIDAANNTHVASQQQDRTLAPEKGQVGIDAVKIGDDKQTAGWLVLYKDPDGGSPIAQKLLIWRDGRIVQRFQTDQTFWSWSFEQGTEQVAFHTGPTHGESTSHSELHDLRTGTRLSSWDGDLEDPNRPVWTRKLDH
jgi:hypothetical protein